MLATAPRCTNGWISAWFDAKQLCRPCPWAKSHRILLSYQTLHISWESIHGITLELTNWGLSTLGVGTVPEMLSVDGAGITIAPIEIGKKS